MLSPASNSCSVTSFLMSTDSSDRTRPTGQAGSASAARSTGRTERRSAVSASGLHAGVRWSYARTSAAGDR